MTSGEALESTGKYAFMTTTDAPKPTLAQMANSATKIHSGDEDDSGRKRWPRKNRERRMLVGVAFTMSLVADRVSWYEKIDAQDSRLSAMLPMDTTIKACNATDIE